MSVHVQVVIVDEACLSRNVLLKALGSWGYDCRTADTEASAWAALQDAQKPVILIAHWYAAFVECESFFQKIRRTSFACPVYPVAAISRNVSGSIRRCINGGAADFVSRPYDLDEIRVRLHVAPALFETRVPRLSFS